MSSWAAADDVAVAEECKFPQSSSILLKSDPNLMKGFIPPNFNFKEKIILGNRFLLRPARLWTALGADGGTDDGGDEDDDDDDDLGLGLTALPRANVNMCCHEQFHTC